MLACVSRRSGAAYGSRVGRPARPGVCMCAVRPRAGCAVIVRAVTGARREEGRGGGDGWLRTHAFGARG